jgi:hypothetical protein
LVETVLIQVRIGAVFITPLSNSAILAVSRKGVADMGGPTPRGSPEGWINEILTETNDVKRSGLISDRSIEELALLEAWAVAESEKSPNSKIMGEIQSMIRLVRGLKTLPALPKLDAYRLRRWK